MRLQNNSDSKAGFSSNASQYRAAPGATCGSIPYTSQRCSVCGHVQADNRKGKHFACLQCGHTDDADINAAKNILAAGLAVLAKRESARHANVEDVARSGQPVKRQPALGASDA